MLFAVLIYSVIVAVDFFKVDFFNNLTLASEITLCLHEELTVVKPR